MLTPFRRHTPKCLNGEAGKSGLIAKKLSPEKLRVYEHCGCPCYFSGTWNGVTYPRTSLDLNDWRAAGRACKERMDASDRGLRAPQGVQRVLVSAALEAWHMECRLPPALAPSTMDSHTTMGREILAFLERRKVEPYLDQITADQITAWRGEWVNCRDTTHRTRLAYFGAFTKFCTRYPGFQSPMGLVRKPPAQPISKEDTQPIDIDGSTTNYDAVMKALATTHKPRSQRWSRHGRVTVLDLDIPVEHKQLLTELMYEAGLRSSDAFLFDLRGLTVRGSSAIYEYLPMKTRRKGRLCETMVPLWLANKLKVSIPACRKKGFRPFCDIACPVRELTARNAKDLEALKNALWRAYQSAGIESGVANVHAHRFRNSFAVRNLNDGVRLETVSHWLGHKDIKTTQMYYSPWCESRSDAAQREYEAAQRRRDAGNVVAITG